MTRKEICVSIDEDLCEKIDTAVRDRKFPGVMNRSGFFDLVSREKLETLKRLK